MTKGGFTLIELLVVIAIIGILASIILVSLAGARSQGRDAKRVSDAKSIQTVVEFYSNDHGAYPIPCLSGQSSCSSGSIEWCSYSHPSSNWIASGDSSQASSYAWSSKYIPVMPEDPEVGCYYPWAPSSGSSEYAYYSNGTHYVLFIGLENSNVLGDLASYGTSGSGWNTNWLPSWFSTLTGISTSAVSGWPGTVYIVFG